MDRARTRTVPSELHLEFRYWRVAGLLHVSRVPGDVGPVLRPPSTLGYLAVHLAREGEVVLYPFGC